ncbi:uncharacterized protein DUF397 [Actinomadura pelletieri DSM 43383]|uniref:Uncharacterized protein DUF397 n=1 Tax=Actinomadura pelletieri DSM 43383 TaxID=1120940 RepID=A0A495QUK7_9ACTN|nr:DUF397 domain-containing protein [Actinomadura pelletieri]RKS77111.1 uncharacterized protein DUF397 [Actinomadura pelletieri DSM 43383]
MVVQWRKSSYSGSANDDVCVEVGRLTSGASVGVRDSKNPEAGHLTLTVVQFAALVEQIKREE